MKIQESFINLSQEFQLIIILLCVIIVFLFILMLISNIKKNKKLKKYSPIENIENHKKKLENECLTIENKKKELLKQFQIGELKIQELTKKVELLEETSDMQNIGFFKPTFEFGTSEEYKTELSKIKEKQKKLIKQKNAVQCTAVWTVNNSRNEGKKMTKRNLDFMLRSFNNECDVLISKVSWNNYDSIKNRLINSFNQINKFNEPNASFITEKYLNSKLEELDTTFKYKELLYKEKEEKRAFDAEIREQKKSEDEIQKQKDKIEKEEREAIRKAKIAQDAYDKAIKDFETRTDLEKKLMVEQLRIIKQQLDDAKKIAEEKTGEKITIESMAQHTRMGRVYILSNIGSFGPDICKIGLTRRINPEDRITELSGAAVPFEFDCHAMIASKDAPSLETALHKAFSDKRVNLANLRKEYFRVSLDEIQQWLKSNGYEKVIFTKDREARTYYETQFLLKSKVKEDKKIVEKLNTEDFFNAA